MKNLVCSSILGLCVCLAASVALSGCGKNHEHAKGGEEHAHEAVHGGCLNVIDECEEGHAEVKVEDGTLKCWFVGGGNDTGKAVRVPDKEIVLTVAGEKDVETRTLVLKARSLELAEEKLGDCSYFEGSAEWLKGVKDLEATGSVTFKGTKQTFKIDYPHGYDPDHEKQESGGKPNP